jgi:hypothetical protein
MILAKFFIWFLRFVFGPPSFNPQPQLLFRSRDGEMRQARSQLNSLRDKCLAQKEKGAAE